MVKGHKTFCVTNLWLRGKAGWVARAEHARPWKLGGTGPGAIIIA